MGNIGKIENFVQNGKYVKLGVFFCSGWVRWGASLSEFFACSLGVKQGCLLSQMISEVSDCVLEHGKRGIQLAPGLEEIVLLLFADDIVLVSSTPAGLQNQINNLEKCSKFVSLAVNLDKTKVMVFLEKEDTLLLEKNGLI